MKKRSGSKSQKKSQSLNAGPKRNEGCLNCGTVESYPGGDNSNIRYICGTCTIGLSQKGQEDFEREEKAKAELNKPVIRLKRRVTKKTKERQTLSNC